MSSIIGQIESENPELFALEFGKIAESDFVYTPASTNIDQSASNLVKMYMTIRSGIRSILWDKSNQNIWSYLPLNLEKLLNLTVYTPASTNIDQSAPNLIKMYVTIRLRMSSIMDLIGPELS